MKEQEDQLPILQEMQKTIMKLLIQLNSFEKSPEIDNIQLNLKKTSIEINSLTLKNIIES